MGSLFSTATFRTIGSAATPQNLFTIMNVGANRIVRVRRLVMQMDATAVLVAVMPLVKTSRIAAATNGTALTKVAFDTAATASHADIEVRGSAPSDGGALSAVTATAGDILWQQYGMRLHTAVGQVLGLDNNQLSMICETYPVLLRQNQGLLVQIVAAIGTSNPATNHYFVQAIWEEDAV